MAGPTTDRVRVLGSLLWHTRAGKGNRAEFSVVGAEPAQRLVQVMSIRVGEAEVAFPAGSCDDTIGEGNAAMAANEVLARVSGRGAEGTTHVLAQRKRGWPPTSPFHRYWTGVR